MRAPKRKRKPGWYDADAFWRGLYQFMFSEKRFAEAADLVPKLLALAEPRGKAVLDLCCGPGRFAIPLARAGYRVTGVDKSAILLARARANARSAKVSVEWIRKDMRDFVRPGAFDLAVNLFTSFGYFEDPGEDLRVLANILRSLRLGGVLVMDLMGKEVLARIAQPSICDLLPDGSKLLQRPEIVDGWERIRHEWTLIRGARASTFHFENTVYSGRELTDLLVRAGFGQVKLHGSMDGEGYGINAKRLVAVARKDEVRR